MAVSNSGIILLVENIFVVLRISLLQKRVVPKENLQSCQSQTFFILPRYCKTITKQVVLLSYALLPISAVPNNIGRPTELN